MARAKLLPSQVLRILAERREQHERYARPLRTLASIGSRYGVTAETVRQIEMRRTWKKLTEEDGVCR